MSVAGSASGSSHTPSPSWSFDQLKNSYNFRHSSDRVELFLALIAEEAARHQRPVRAVDIGCG
jgi:hypothetical protein